MFWLAILASIVLVDCMAGIRSRNCSYAFGGDCIDDFRILVPIWGNVSYLVNSAILSQYGSRVTLCTTGDETPEFYAGITRIAAGHGFWLFRDEPQHRLEAGAPAGAGRAAPQGRATSGTVRDRLIRQALAGVTESYV